MAKNSLYRLGIDLGSASVGMAACSLKSSGGKPLSPDEFIYGAVRIFEDPLEPPKSSGVGKPKKAARREARSARKQYRRKKQRLKKIVSFAPRLGLDAVKIAPDKGQTVIRRRAEAVDKEISMEDFFLVLMHIAKKRGYMGEFRPPPAKKGKAVKGKSKVDKDVSDDSVASSEEEREKDLKTVQKGIKDLKKEMKDHNCETVGQYLCYRLGNNHLENKRHCRLKEDKLYVKSDMIREEFDLIWEEQQKYHPILTDNELKKDIENTIFYKRSLKSPALLVGKCQLNPELPRAPRAQPWAQAFRIEKQMADLMFREEHGQDISPNDSHKKLIRELLQEHEKVTFKKIHEHLEKNGGVILEDGEILKNYTINLAEGGREELRGDSTATAIRKLELKEQWEGLSEEHKVSVINLLADMGSPDVFYGDNWHEEIFCAKNGEKRKFEDKKAVVSFINEMKDSDKFGSLIKMGFEGGRSNYCVKTLKALTEYMREHGVDEYTATDKLKERQFFPAPEKQQHKALKPPQTGNLVVDVAMRQFVRELNKVEKEHGEPTEIVIEMSRDMRLGQKQREKLSKKMKENEKNRNKARRELIVMGLTATQRNILRYQLWEEQEKRWCPYCDVPINNGDAFDGSKTNLEHVLPKSLSWIGKQRNSLVLAHRGCNDEKANHTPWQAWGHDNERWDIIKARVKIYEKNKRWRKAKQLLYEGDDHMSDEAIAGFSDRQFAESSWLAKIAGKWLREKYPEAKVSFSRGLLTAHLRRTWGLETVIPNSRYADNLPVLQQAEDGETVNKDMLITHEFFTKHESAYAGHLDESEKKRDKIEIPRLDKRIDHRHHLVDAAVICMTSVSLFQKMTKHYQEVTARGGDNRLRLYAEPPLKEIKIAVKKLVQDIVISHRPDHWPGGVFFMDNPYAVKEKDGERKCLKRKHLNALVGKGASLDQARKKIENIFHEDTKQIVLAAFEEGIKNGLKPFDALQEPIYHPAYHTSIRRVLVIYIKGNADEAVKVMHKGRKPPKKKGDAVEKTDLHKFLLSDKYAYLEIYQSEGKYKKRLVRAYEVKKKDESVACRFYKGDTVAMEGKHYVIRKIIAQANGKLFLQPTTESLTVDINAKIAKGTKVIRTLSKVEDFRALSLLSDHE